MRAGRWSGRSSITARALPRGSLRRTGEAAMPKKSYAYAQLEAVGAAIGAAAAGSKAIARTPSMAPIYAIEFVQNQAGKIRSMTGGQASMPFVLWNDGGGGSGGGAGAHT